jgi:hypothetical protein
MYFTGMDQDLIQRAFNAFLRSDGLAAEQPTSASSVETICGDRRFVVLRNEQRVLAVYRVRCGILRRAKRWPITFTANLGSERDRTAFDTATLEGVAST